MKAFDIFSITPIFVLLLAFTAFSGCSTHHCPEEPGKTGGPGHPVASGSPCEDSFGLESSEPESPSQAGLPSLNAHVSSPLADPRIVIHKRARELCLYSGSRLVRIYPISLGKDPLRDKVHEGDSRTPEGRFYVCTKNPRSRFYLSMGISYPNMEDAERGFRDGLISRSEHDAIVQSISEGGIPLWKTGLGGEIFIHGGGATWDWTEGCIALNNDDIAQLYSVIPLGTPVEIYK